MKIIKTDDAVIAAGGGLYGRNKLRLRPERQLQ
jgi:hypothetical protein